VKRKELEIHNTYMDHPISSRPLNTLRWKLGVGDMVRERTDRTFRPSYDPGTGARCQIIFCV